MSSTALLPLAVSKEARALALPWLACMACIVAPRVMDVPYLLRGISVPAYFLGAAAVGALSVGREYTDRTLSLLLTLPVRRERLFAVKLGVLAAMLLALWAVADGLVFDGDDLNRSDRQVFLLLPVLCGLFLAPWLTMVCRNPIAGTVFSLTIPGVLMALGEVIGTAKYGGGPVAEAFRMAFTWYATLGLCAIGGVLSWRMFMRLETAADNDAAGQDVRLPLWLQSRNPADSAATQFTRRSAVWQLLKKELHLQQLPLVLAGLYVFGWLSVVVLTAVFSDWKYGYAFSTLTFLYAGLLPMLIGSSASAGERQIGVLESQLLLPMAAWKQWAGKVGVVFGLAIALSLGLPAMLVSLDRAIGVAGPVPAPPILLVVLFSTGSLYVSSLCRSSLWALLMSLAATAGAVVFHSIAFQWLTLVQFAWLFAGITLTELRIEQLLQAVMALLIAGFIVLVLWFALVNHRSADRRLKRAWQQSAVIVGFVTVGVVILVGIINVAHAGRYSFRP